MSGVFLSYRREDVGLIAADVADALQSKINALVFFDLQSIDAGTDWQKEIDAALRRSSVVVVLLGKDWFGRTDDGHRRIDQPEDIFRKEVETALQFNTYVIPVLVGVPSVDAKSLGAIRSLADLQWHQIRLGQKEDDVNKLVEKVQQVLHERRQAVLSGQKDGPLRIEPYLAPLSFVEPPRELASVPMERVLFYNEDLNFRINVALISGRPLLIVGSERAGRSGIAFHVAKALQRRLYIHTATAESTAQDLLYSFDDVRRLHDAQTAMRMISDSYYIEPGVVWWAFDRNSARCRGALEETAADFPYAIDPARAVSDARDSIILLESLENLKPSDANELLTVLSNQTFFVKDTRFAVHASGSILVIFTANSLRKLDPQVQRNTIVYELPYPSIGWMAENALSHFPEDQHRYIEKVANVLTKTIDERGVIRRLELDDFLTIVNVVLEMKIEPDGTNWRILLDSLGLLR